MERGKPLFEIAPLNSYRLVVQVDERDVRYVAIGQSGAVAFAEIPDPVADDPQQDYASHGRRRWTEFFPYRGSAHGIRSTFATGDGRRRENRNRAALTGLDLDARHRRMAESRRLEVPALSAGNECWAIFEFLLVSRRGPSAKAA